MYEGGQPTVGVPPRADLLDQIVACEREVAAAQARQLVLIAAFARSRPALVGERVQAGASEFAVDELAAELRLSRRAAGARLELAVTLSERLPGTSAALAAGDLDLSRARLVAEATDPLDPPAVAVVEQRVLPRAATQTFGQLRASLTRAVLAVDPAGARVRHEREVAGRRVAVTALSDGMAELWALLPAPAATAIYTAIDVHARRPHQPADVPIDARRADALLDLVTRHPVPLRKTTTAHVPPAAPAAHEAVAAAVAADEVAVAAAAADEVAYGMAERMIGNAAAGQVALAPLVRVTVAATTLLGLDDQPAELAGHGPIPAEIARQVAADPSGTWRRILTDPATGAVLDVDHRTYRPPRPLARYVVARDATCRFPGCRQPARRCDLDHVTPWPDGPTSAANLIAACRHHHRLKHSGRWRVSSDRDGTVTWTSPTGRTYSTRPPPVGEPTASAEQRPPPRCEPPAPG
jgi:Domain of unknown function (DUF222)